MYTVPNVPRAIGVSMIHLPNLEPSSRSVGTIRESSLRNLDRNALSRPENGSRLRDFAGCTVA